MTKHARVKDQLLCETTFFSESVVDTTRSAYFDIDCPKCLRHAIAASEVRTYVLRELLAKVETTLGTEEQS